MALSALPLKPASFPKLTARRAPWLTMLCVVALLLVSPGARAAAPLCDPSGASIAAPIPVLPNATGDLVAPKSCDDTARGAFDLGKAPRNDAPPLRVVDAPPRLVAQPLVWPRQVGTKIARPDRASTPDLPGHSLPVYRPPRA